MRETLFSVVAVLALLVTTTRSAFYFDKIGADILEAIEVEEQTELCVSPTNILRGRPVDLHVVFTFPTEVTFSSISKKGNVVLLYTADGDSARFYKSNDNGINWLDCSLPGIARYNDDQYFYSIDSSILPGYWFLYRSSNGENWEKIFSDENEYILDFGVNNEVGYLYLQKFGEIKISYDHGTSWQVTGQMPPDSHQLTHCSDKLICRDITSENNKTILKASEDLGNSWTQFYVFDSNLEIFQAGDLILAHSHTYIQTDPARGYMIVNEPIVYLIDAILNVAPYMVIPDIYTEISIDNLYISGGSVFLKATGEHNSMFDGFKEIFISTDDQKKMNEVSLIGVPEESLLGGEEVQIDMRGNVQTVQDFILNYYAVLEAYGMYFFAPAWTPEVMSYPVRSEPGIVERNVLEIPWWPYNVGSGAVTFYACVMLKDELVSNIEMKNFSWTDN